MRASLSFLVFATLALLLVPSLGGGVAQGGLRASMGAQGDTGQGDGGDTGMSGESGESGLSEEEAEAEEAKQAELLNKVKELAAIHREAQEELAEALKGNTKMTAEAKSTVMKRGATADSTDSALINSLSANEAAVKALAKSRKAHKALIEAKLAAGIKVGKRRGGVEAQICRKKLKEKEKDARRMAKRAHAEASKAWASSQFTKLKMRKAAAIAKELQDAKSRDQMEAMLKRSNKASEEAKAARAEAIEQQAKAAKLQAEADDIREEASRIADECSFLLAKNTIGGLGWKAPGKEGGAAAAAGVAGDTEGGSGSGSANPLGTGSDTDMTVKEAESKLFGLDQKQDGFSAGQHADQMLKETVPVYGKPPSASVEGEARKLLAASEESANSDKKDYPMSRKEAKESRQEKVEDIAAAAEAETASSMH